MLRFFISVSAAALMSSAAFAADLPVFQPGAVMTAPVPMASNWTGFYVGVQGGYAFGGDGGEVFFDSDDNGDFDESSSGDDRDGFTIGAKIGYDVQVNRFVVGAVADLNYLDFDSDVNFESEAGDSLNFNESIDWFATLRARAGFLVTETILLYGHGGLAYASTDADGSFFDNEDGEDDDVKGSFGDDGDEWGWTIGAGVEAAVTQNIRVGLEYSYLNFGDGDDDDDGSDIFDYERADADFHTIRASASYKF